MPIASLRWGLRNSASDDGTGRKNMHLLIQLRWIAVLGQIATIAVTHFGFGVELPLNYMVAVLLGLVAFNGISLLRLRLKQDVTNTELMVSLLVDVFTLTIQLYLSGGTANPFIFLFLLQVVLGAVLLETWSTLTILVATTLCFVWLALADRPLLLPADYERGHHSYYVKGMMICFVLNAALLVIFISRITRNRRARDARLAELRQRAAEEEHIVRMGLLASGAAHELGTPLSTLSVILGDWRRMPAFNADPDVQQELDEMQAQVLRCKSIVSGILLSAGEARGEAAEETTLHRFLDDLVADWRATRPVHGFRYQNHFGEDLDIVSDSAIRQSIANVLDNALEASPEWVGLDVTREEAMLVITVRDRGPGFPPAILEQLGRPYHSTKGRPGSGLGLFLVMNVARTLGGNLSAHNMPQGGACVALSLPLSAITLEEE